MKKYLHIAAGVMSLVAVTGIAQAAEVTTCTGAGGNGSTVAAAGTTGFVQVGFIPKCSQNVLMSYDQVSTYFAVGSASSKGKNSFNGNTVGGSVKPYTAATCPSSGCTTTQVTSALGAAMTDASSGQAASEAAGSGSGT
jgi:hypothetical protein